MSTPADPCPDLFPAVAWIVFWHADRDTRAGGLAAALGSAEQGVNAEALLSELPDVATAQEVTERAAPALHQAVANVGARLFNELPPPMQIALLETVSGSREIARYGFDLWHSSGVAEMVNKALPITHK